MECCFLHSIYLCKFKKIHLKHFQILDFIKELFQWIFWYESFYMTSISYKSLVQTFYKFSPKNFGKFIFLPYNCITSQGINHEWPLGINFLSVHAFYNFRWRNPRGKSRSDRWVWYCSEMARNKNKSAHRSSESVQLIYENGRDVRTYVKAVSLFLKVICRSINKKNVHDNKTRTYFRLIG